MPDASTDVKRSVHGLILLVDVNRLIAGEAIVAVAERVTIADLCDRWQRLQGEPMPVIDYVI